MSRNLTTLLLFLLSRHRSTAGRCRGAAALLSWDRGAFLPGNCRALLSGHVFAALLRDLARLLGALLTRDCEASLARNPHRNRFALLPIHCAALLSWHRAERLKSWREKDCWRSQFGSHTHTQGTCTAALGPSCIAVEAPGAAPGHIVGGEPRCTVATARSHTETEVLVRTLGWGRHR